MKEIILILTSLSLSIWVFAQTDTSTTTQGNIAVNAKFTTLPNLESKEMVMSMKMPEGMNMDMAGGMKMDMSQKMNMSGDGKMMHGHMPIALADTAITPELTISLSKDEMSGYNLHLAIANFQLESPINAGNAPDRLVEGHAHLYINGKKIQRVYGNDVHVPSQYFKKGINQINVTLNNHEHKAWQKDGKDIISSVFINTEKTQFVIYQFSTFPALTQ